MFRFDIILVGSQALSFNKTNSFYSLINSKRFHFAILGFFNIFRTVVLQ